MIERACCPPLLVPARAGLGICCLLFFSGLLTGCGEELLPDTVVNHLRVLGIRAEPAELRPGETSRLSALVTDPSRPGRPNTMLWLGCEPDPLALGRSACSDTKVLQDPASLAPPEGGAPSELPPGMSVIGLGPNAFYSVPAELFAPLASDDPRRVTGSVGQALLLAVAEEVSPAATSDELRAVLERVRARETPSVLALFRIRVSEDPQVNTNPTLGALRAAGRIVPEGASLLVKPGETLPLELEAPESARESYVQRTPTGDEARTEQLLTAWYSTEGRFEHRRVALDSQTDFPQAFLAPGEASRPPLPESRRGALWVVVRDTRGGQVWREAPIFYCDPSLPVPSVNAVAPAEGEAGGQLALKGENLASILEVVVGGALVESGGYSPGEDAFVGRIPPLPPGTHPIVIRGRHCGELETGLTFTVR